MSTKLIEKQTQAIAHRPAHRAVHEPAGIPPFLAGDVIVFAGQGDPYSKVARWLMRDKGEGPTYSVHTAHFLDSRRVLEMDFTVKVKSVDDVVHKRYALDMWQRRGFEVWRCVTLTEGQRRALTRQSWRYLNVKFGMVRFWAHLLDDLIGKLVGREFFFFRHIDPEDRRPVCSGVTASVYDKALHYRFGVDPECADPDDIYDWVTTHPGEWVCVFRLEAYEGDPRGRMSNWSLLRGVVTEAIRAVRS